MPPVRKFGYLTSEGIDTPFVYSDTWAVEKTSGPERIKIGPSSGHVALLAELSKILREPMWLLYVLDVPRDESRPGRYQSQAPLARIELKTFLDRFREYFEFDGRHDIWIKEVSGPSLLVYDRHNVIYAYGSLEEFKQLLITKGLKQVPQVSFPAPHSHHYNAEYDLEQTAVLDYLPWKFSPLSEADDD
jgi:hypothetical protein